MTTTRDVSRFLFQPRKHYGAARLQQGRTLLDSDFDEGADLEQEEWRRAVLDIVGPRGTPDGGFAINHSDEVPIAVNDVLFTTPVTVAGQPVDVIPFSLHVGTFYLGGLRLQMPGFELVVFQHDFLQMGLNDISGLLPGAHALFYLEAWEQDVSVVEDDQIQERALGGPDATVRTRRFRRVRTVSNLRPGISCDDAFAEQMKALEDQLFSTFDCQTSELRSNARMQLIFQDGSDNDPCTPDPPTQYLGTENQTIRIMLTSPSTYVWAFDNAAPLYRVTVPDLRSAGEGNAGPKQTTLTVKMVSPFLDEARKPRKDQVVELVPFGAVIDALEGALDPAVPPAPHAGRAAAEIGHFAAVADTLTADGTFTIDVTGRLAEFQSMITRWDGGPGATQQDANDLTDPCAVYLRLWHDRPADQPVEISIGEFPGAPLGDTGIIPLLLAPGRPGDFWIAAARPDAPDRLTPFDLMTTGGGVPPHGPHHFFAPLAVIELSGTTVSAYHDCRSRMQRLTDAGCATFTVGDGVHNRGDFTRIQDAIDALPEEGGRVFILPGIYRQEVEISDRPDVTLEGCGDRTIIETPFDNPSSVLIEVQSSPRTTLAGLRLHGVERQALSVDDSDDVTLSAISAFAFVTVDDVRQQGSGTETGPLVALRHCFRPRIDGLHLEPATRGGLAINDSSDGAVSALSGVGATGTGDVVVSSQAPVEPMVVLDAVQRVALRDVALSTFGQKGIELRPGLTSQVTLSRVTISADQHALGPMRTAIDIDGDQITLDDSDISVAARPTDEATIAAGGSAIIIRGTRVNAASLCIPDGDSNCGEQTTPAWGGIQIRGNATDVQIVGNHIQGGLGHGITLGSVTWSSGTGNTRREGAGKAQVIDGTAPRRFVTGNLANGFTDPAFPGVTFHAADDGPIQDLLIAENRIEGCSTNGISALTVFGLASSGSTDLLELDSVRIERNTITNNILHPYNQITTRGDVLPFPAAMQHAFEPQELDLAIPVLPLGGIVLATVLSRLTISGNTVSSNTIATFPDRVQVPVNGIFILNGDGIVIEKNRITNNGAEAVPNTTLHQGVRGGIAIMLAGTDTAGSSDDLDALLEPGGGNALDSTGIALRVTGNDVQHLEGRALHAVAAGSMSIEGNFLSSRGYHGAPSPNEEFAIGDVVFLQNLGTPWESLDAGNIPEEDGTPEHTFSPNRTAPIPTGARTYLTNANTGSPRMFTGAGGSVLFSNNQVVHDWTVEIPPADATIPLSFFAVVMMTLDHLGCVGNHFAMRIDNIPSGLPPPLIESLPGGDDSFAQEPLLSHALLGGGTTQVARNRFAENVLAASLSAITAGEMLNITTFNQATHPIFAYRWPRVRNANQVAIEQPETFTADANTALFVRGNVDYGRFREDLLHQIRRFFDLLHQA